VLYIVGKENHHVKIWINAFKSNYFADNPTESGWVLTEDGLKPLWTRLPAIPKGYLQLVTCGCSTKWSTARCKCYQSGQVCLFECKCEATGCSNPFGNVEDTPE
jgi:hypothetical protein